MPKQYSDEELLGALCEYVDEHGEVPRVADINDADGYPSQSPYFARWGSWARALEAAGLEPRKQGRHALPDEDLLADLRDLAESGTYPTYEEVRERDDMTDPETYASRWGSWVDALEAAGVHDDTSHHRRRATHSYGIRACQHALRRVASHLDTNTLSVAVYDETRWDAEPASGAILRTLSEDRKWSEALATVGLSSGTPGGGRRYSVEDCKRALWGALAETGPKLTKEAYREWATDHEAPAPGTIADRLGDGYWAAAVESVGGIAGGQGRTGPR